MCIRDRFQRRLQEIGGITPLVFGQYGELSASFEALIDTLAIKGCDQAADRYLLDVGPGAASVQKRLLRQRELLRRSRAGWGASRPSQVRPPGVDRGGVAPRGLGAEVRPTGGTGACFLGRGPLGGVGLLLLWLLPLRWEGTRGPRGARVPRGRGYRLYAKEPLSPKKNDDVTMAR